MSFTLTRTLKHSSDRDKLSSFLRSQATTSLTTNDLLSNSILQWNIFITILIIAATKKKKKKKKLRMKLNSDRDKLA